MRMTRRAGIAIFHTFNRSSAGRSGKSVNDSSLVFAVSEELELAWVPAPRLPLLIEDIAEMTESDSDEIGSVVLLLEKSNTLIYK